MSHVPTKFAKATRYSLLDRMRVTIVANVPGPQCPMSQLGVDVKLSSPLFLLHFNRIFVYSRVAHRNCIGQLQPARRLYGEKSTMPASSPKPGGSPRVFISYARSDGEEYARNLHTRLEKEGIPCWMDRFGMEGGKDWRQQILEALDTVEFLVLVMTPAAIGSPNVQWEWRSARQQGVCVYPVKAAPSLDYSRLPRWMGKSHFYTLDAEWPKLVNDLNTRCEKIRIPFIPYDVPDDFVPRPKEYEQLLGTLLNKHEEPVAITTAALRGAGGYGKTTMAIALCHNDKIQETFDGGILWVTLGQNPGNLLGKVEDLIYTLNREKPGFTSLEAAIVRLRELLAERDFLLVIDDVWDASHLTPFLNLGKRCVRLITTRNATVLPSDARTTPVDAMQQTEAERLLSANLVERKPTDKETKALRDLTARLGECALLLKLANGFLRERVKGGQTVLDALTFLQEALDECGLTFFDQEAVEKMLVVSFKLLSTDELARYQELAIFPEDVDIPLATLQTFWRATAGLGKIKTELLCERLYKLSLLLRFDPVNRTIRLHDVVRTYLQHEAGATKLTALHNQLLDSYNLKRWADLPHDEPYLWDHLAYHLVGAQRSGELIATVKDLRYLARKVLARSAYRVETDLLQAEQHAPSDLPLRLLTRQFVNMEHLLNWCDTLNSVASTLQSRLEHLTGLSDLCNTFAQELPRPSLSAWHPLPDLPPPALIRTLQGHTGGISGCAVSPDGTWIVSASGDGTLKVWDAHTGEVRLTLEGHTEQVSGCAVSPDGTWIVSASLDHVLKVWDARTGEVRLTLQGHTKWVTGCAVSPDGTWIVSASGDGTLKMWDAHTGEVRHTLQGHTGGISGCAVSPDGTWIVSASDDGTLKVWNAHTGEVRLTLQGHTRSVTDCAVSPDGTWIVSASWDGTLKVWDARTREARLTLEGHTDFVTGCAVSPDGTWIVSASSDHTLKVWDARSGEVRLTLEGHTDGVNSCAVSPDGTWIVSAGSRTLKVWDAHTGEVRLTLYGDTDWVRGCAVSPDGTWIVSASSDHTLKVWDAHTGEVRLTLYGHTHLVTGCAVSPDGTWIVSASWDGTLKMWDAHTGKVRLTLHGHAAGVYGCAVSPDGTYIVSASDDDTLKVWDASTGACLMTFPVEGALEACVFHPDGRHLVAGGAGGMYFLEWVP
jgi:WD40 repeat protein